MEGSQRSEVAPRRPAKLEVDCATEEMTAPVTLVTKDVGAGGLFIRTEYPLETGTRFGTRFDLGDGKPILAECEVAWIRTGPPEIQPAPGMGVRFVALEPLDARRLEAWVTGEEATEDGEKPRMTFRIEGLAQTVPGELRASSEEGMSAVAELPFLQVGSAVQVTVDDAGAAGPRAGRIAWLVMEDNEDDDTGPPRVRIGIHFDPAAEAALAAAKCHQSPREPIPLTHRKPGSQANAPRAECPMAMGVPDPTSAAGGSVATPWSFGSPDMAPSPGIATSMSVDPSLGMAPSRDRAAATRRRVRPRQGKGRINVGQALQSLRASATRNPKAAAMVAAFIAVLLIGLLGALALSGRGGSPAAKTKTPTQTAAQGPDSLQGEDPQGADQRGVDQQGNSLRGPSQGPPGLPSTADPGAGPAQGVGPDAPPPLPGQATGGRQVLASGPNVNADPEKVLKEGKTEAGAPGLLSDPQAPGDAPKNLHFYTLGNKLVVKLPTKGKPQSVKHYLLANPDGVVVDAVGAAPSLRPGRYPIKDPRVNFVRVLHRGPAARFIVYYSKGVKGAKASVMPSEEGVSFVVTTTRGGPAPATAQRGAPSKAGAKTAMAPSRTASKGKASSPNKTTGKLRTPPPRSTTQKRPAAPRGPAPIADAEDLPLRP